MRRTKIVVTLGPKSWDPRVIEAMIAAGVDVFRLNLSHVKGERDYVFLAAVAKEIRRLACEAAKEIEIMADCPGHKLRLGEFVERDVSVGDVVKISSNPIPVNGELPFPYKKFLRLVQPGQEVVVGDGAPRFIVETAASPDVICRVSVAGRLKPYKGLTVRGFRISDLRLRPYTKQDERGMQFAVMIEAEHIIISYATKAEQAVSFRKFYQQQGGGGSLKFKYELAEAGEDLGQIVLSTDSGYVGQGDLGLSLPHEKVPAEAIKVVRAYRAAGKLCDVGTEVLFSMKSQPFPSHGETAGIYWLVSEGVSGIVVSDETSVGEYPIIVVKNLDKTIREAEAFLK